MTSVRIGAAVDALPGTRYFERHGLLELHPPLSFPRAATLAKWRASIPETCEVALAVTRRTHAGKDGALRFDKPGSRAWVDESIAALSPRFVLIATGPELSTGARDRSLLEAFVRSIAERGPTVVWQPRGLWDGDDARAFAAKIGCSVALDLLGAMSGPSPVGPAALAGVELPVARVGPLAYGRLEALGTHARLGDGHLRRALEESLATGAEDVRLVIAAEDAIRKAIRLQALVEGLAEDASGLATPRRRASGEDLDDEDDELDTIDDGEGDEDDEDDDDLDDDDE